MPIRKENKKLDAQQRFRTQDPRVAAFALNERPPEYKQPIPAQRAVSLGVMLPPSTGTDLCYFFDVASGRREPVQHYSPTLVLNYGRATQTHVLPIAERLTLGPAAHAPLYAMSAGPHMTSLDEFNSLKIQRRENIHDVYEDACLSVIQAKLDYNRPGLIKIATIEKNGITYTLNLGNWDSSKELGGCYCLWRDNDQSLMAQLFAEQGWKSMDEQFQQGMIRIRCAKKLMNPVPGGPEYEDPRGPMVEEFGHLDFMKQIPQFVCGNPRGHQILDLLIAMLFTALVTETRRQFQIREWGSLPAYTR